MWRFDDAEIYEIGRLSVAEEMLHDQSCVESKLNEVAVWPAMDDTVYWI